MEDNNKIYQKILKAKTGCNIEMDALVSENMGLVYSISKRFSGRGVDFEDIVQLGAIGLVKAIKNFKPEYNVMFSTYAVPLITGEIKRFLRDDGPIKSSRIYKNIALKYGLVYEKLANKLNREPNIAEIANELQIEREELVLALEATKAPESFYQTTKDDSAYLVDKLSIGLNNDNENTILDNITLKEAINKLSEREKKVIILRFFKEKKQKQIADLLGISQVQVSRIEKKILEKIKEMMV